MRYHARLVYPMLPVLVLTACMSRGLESERTSCTFPDSTRTPAPGFICTGQVEGFPVTRLVSVPAGEASTRERIERGRRDVQHELALTWHRDWFSGIPEHHDGAVRQQIIGWLDEELRVVRTRASPAGSLYVLVGVPETPDVIQARLRARLAAAGIDTEAR